MEFKQPSNKKVNFSSKSSKDPNQKPKKALKWFEEDEEWLDLLNSVEDDVKKEKTKKSLFRKKHSAFDKNLEKPPNKNPKKTKFKKPLSLVKNNKKVFIALAIVIALAISGYLLMPNDAEEKGIAGVSTNTVSPDDPLPREKPEFQILYPGNKNSDSIGEIVKNSPPNTAPVYVYTDNIGGVNVQVSQQQLPERFKENQDGELQKLAESFQASNVIQVDSLKVFYGESSSGVQSLIFVKGNLLILIASSQKISDDTWAAYISALHT